MYDRWHQHTRGGGTMAVDLLEPETAEDELASPIYQAEMRLVAYLSAMDPGHRHCTALARRGRGPGEARGFAHAGDLASRLPDFFTVVREDGRISVEHLDRLWLVINRHIRDVPAVDVATVRAALDLGVECALLNWLDSISTTAPIAIETLVDLAEEVIITLSSDLVSCTEVHEQESARAYRRDNRIILDCGNRAVATRLWNAVNEEGWRRLRELKKDREIEDVGGTLAECRAEVLLNALGNDGLSVTVNLYRTSQDGTNGSGPGFIPGVSWMSVTAADVLEDYASQTRLLGDDLTEVHAYRFLVKHRAEIAGRDAHCRFPFCTVPADQCELDHTVNSPHTDPTSNGPTSVANGQCLCRLHHRMKTLKVWQYSTEDDRITIDWIGPDGHSYSTTAGGPLVRMVSRGTSKLTERHDRFVTVTPRSRSDGTTPSPT